jgi:hypothetical protein
MAPVEKPPRIDPARVQQEQEEGHNACIAFATDEAECANSRAIVTP